MGSLATLAWLVVGALVVGGGLVGAAYILQAREKPAPRVELRQHGMIMALRGMLAAKAPEYASELIHRIPDRGSKVVHLWPAFALTYLAGVIRIHMEESRLPAPATAELDRIARGLEHAAGLANAKSFQLEPVGAQAFPAASVSERFAYIGCEVAKLYSDAAQAGDEYSRINGADRHLYSKDGRQQLADRAWNSRMLSLDQLRLLVEEAAALSGDHDRSWVAQSHLLLKLAGKIPAQKSA